MQVDHWHTRLHTDSLHKEEFHPLKTLSALSGVSWQGLQLAKKPRYFFSLTGLPKQDHVTRRWTWDTAVRACCRQIHPMDLGLLFGIIYDLTTRSVEPICKTRCCDIGWIQVLWLYLYVATVRPSVVSFWRFSNLLQLKWCSLLQNYWRKKIKNHLLAAWLQCPDQKQNAFFTDIIILQAKLCRLFLRTFEST